MGGRKIYLLLFFGLLFTTVQAQDPQLLPNDWYLEKMIIDGEDLPLPDNSDITFVDINFFTDNFDTTMCDGLFVGVANYSSDTIEMNDFAFITLDLCDLQENIDYSTVYLGFFGAPQPGNASIIDYEIIAINDYLQLILTNEDGNQAIYNNTLLNTTRFETQEVSIYPNPVAESLVIETNEPVESWTIYNLQGQRVLQGEKAVRSIPVSSLTQGVYFLELEFNNKKLIKKFVKQ